MFKPISLTADAIREPAQPLPEQAVNTVFKVLHGFYGNLFLSKYATSETDANGQDSGVVSARQIWAHGLRRFNASTVRAALSQCLTQHPEFPPSLPQFVALCAANEPREAYQPEPALGMSQTLRSEYAAKARAIVAKHDAKTKPTFQTEPSAAGLDLLKQAIANAVATAGGDEVATLLRLDRELAPRGVAA